MVVAACSPAPPEHLRDPRPLPNRCKTPAQIAELERPILDASKGRRDTVLERFVAERKLTLTGENLPAFYPSFDPSRHGNDARVRDSDYVDRAIEKAIDSANRAGGKESRLVVDLGRPAWSQVIVDFGVFEPHPCGDYEATEYLLAHDPSGAAVAVRAHTSRTVVTIGEQCGECSVGCGSPSMHMEWEAVVLPIATGAAVRIENVELVEDEVRVRCEREVQAI